MANGIIMTLKKFKLLSISGDASFRQYYRKTNKKKNLSTIIVISKKEKYKNLLVYSAINQFLLNHNIRTPRLLAENYNKGFIEIEDFGNITICPPFCNVFNPTWNLSILSRRVWNKYA